MPYFDADGQEVEGLMTQEELDTKLEEQSTSLNKEHDEAQAASNERIGALEADKTTAQAAVDAAAAAAAAGGGNKEENLAGLREKLDKTNTALEEERKTNNDRYESGQKDSVNKAVKAVAGDDAELEAKIRHNYDTMLSGVKAETAEEVAQKVASAARLSVDPDTTPNPLDIARTGDNRGAQVPIVPGAEAKKFNDNEVSSGNMMGISDADRAKYANDPRMKNTK